MMAVSTGGAFGLVVVLALGAGLANALTSVFQRMGVEDAPDDATLRLSLLTHALRRGVWMLGFALMVASFLLQAIALHLGRLSEVQPILTTELIFLVIVLGIWFGFAIGPREWLGVIATAGGLAGFLYFAHPEEGNTTPPTWEWLVVGAPVALSCSLPSCSHSADPAGGGRPCSERPRRSASPSRLP